MAKNFDFKSQILRTISPCLFQAGQIGPLAGTTSLDRTQCMLIATFVGSVSKLTRLEPPLS